MGSIRRFASTAASLIYRPGDNIAEEYHKWYFGALTYLGTSWLGVPCLKSVSDMWNYQEILTGLGPGLVVEFGTHKGGSALYFATVLRGLGRPFHVLTVDINHQNLHERARQDPDIEFLESSSTAPAVAERIRDLRAQLPGPVFAILDGDHTRDHVLAEMQLLRPLLTPGDYLVVEDACINGHPIMPGWGPGPFEAIEAYEAQYPDDYRHDRDRERKFGFAFATNGFLVRT
jgi:cephalosporin hydroxylase